MKILKRGRNAPSDVTGIQGVARPIHHKDKLGRKVGSGDIVIVDHTDIDLTSAEVLVERGVRAVVNVSPSISGRYPNLGPQVLVRAGISIIDNVGTEIWAKVKSGDNLKLENGEVFKEGELIASGVELDDDQVRRMLESAQSSLSTRLESMSANTGEHLRLESDMLLEGARIPRLRTPMKGRPVVVVSRSYDYESDLATLKDYIAGHDPILIGAGAGADALIAAGYQPTLVVGSLGTLSDRALKQGGEVIVTTASTKTAAVDRLEKAGVDAQNFVASGSDEDLALLLADRNEASVIVLAGGHRSLVEFLDRGPTDMASTFLARLRTGSKLVDAKSVGEFYNHRISVWPLIAMIVVGIIAVGFAVAVTPVGESWLDWAGDQFTSFFHWIQGFVS